MEATDLGGSVTDRPLKTHDIVAGLRNAGIEAGSALFVHSSLSSLGWVDGAEHAVIDALLQAVGPPGLLAMPTHTWSTVNARQPVFHQSFSPSIVGRLTESFRQRPGVVRSLHPTHSVAAVGVGAEEFVRHHERYSTPCAPPSPYGQIVDRAGTVLLLGVGLERCTLMHAFEEWAGVPWLFNRTELLYSITAENRAYSVPSRRHTNDPRWQRRNFPALEPALLSSQAVRYASIGNATVRIVEARRAAECLVPLIAGDPDIVVAPGNVGTDPKPS
jgi:aminoglycoside 3-N-acetyltransferase